MLKPTPLFLGLLALAIGTQARYYGNYNCEPGRDVMVHLFEWKHSEVGRECEEYLGPNGYCAVQVSPVSEHIIHKNPDYPWWQRYQPVSYKLTSRSGDENALRDMIRRCNNAGVRVYVDVVINHMTGGGRGRGSAGSLWDADTLDYPGVPYNQSDFNGHDNCPTDNLEIQSSDPVQVRNCRLMGLRDVRAAKEYVRANIAKFMNTLIDMGVAGFRVDAAKHMWPKDLENIFSRLHYLNTEWFAKNIKPFVVGEVIDLGGEPIKSVDYTFLTRVTEIQYGLRLGAVVRKENGQRLAYLKNFRERWGLLDDMSALTFVDNHDNQRGHGAGGKSILTFWEPRIYIIGQAFTLAYPYGYPRVMSSYRWDRRFEGGRDVNDWQGPPSRGKGDIKDVECFSEWVCEHRWRQISNMVKFHNIAVGEPVSKWWDNGYQAIAFARGRKAFIVINNEDYSLDQTFDTGLPEGEYCDVISCGSAQKPCGGGEGCKKVYVDSSGLAKISVGGENPIVAIHV